MPGTKAPEAQRREEILVAAYEVAAREGLDGTTILQVADAAGLSPGLVMFHFKSKRQLLLALLDWLLTTTTVLRVVDEIAQLPSPLERLLALLRQEMHRLAREPLRIRLTFDYWSAGVRDAEIRAKLKTEFDRYREAFRPLAEAVLREQPERFVGVTPDGLSAVAVSFIKGCAVQSMIDPEHFDIRQYLAAAEGLIAQFGVTTMPVTSS
jgi:TetR/AcrR family transcriptional regulator, transcriptional repressor of bet genes